MSKKSFNFFEYLLTYHRGAFATIILIPISVVYSSYLSLRSRLVFLLNTAPKDHEKRVEKVKQQVIEWANSGSTQKLTTSRSGWFTMSELVPAYKKTNHAIEMNMRDIIYIDYQKQTIKVEPLVNMGQITAMLNQKGWTLQVVPELDNLTVGGLINGFGIESSSHKYGLFQYTIASIDIITADGTFMHCSATENQTLFYNIQWSHGTLGFLVCAELYIIPCSKFVELTYQPIYGLDNIVQKFEDASRNKEYQFIELLQYSRDEAVLMTGNFAKDAFDRSKINRIGRFYKPWFYKQVEKFLKNNSTSVEYIPLRDYYHRHTRSLFWEMEEVIPFGNSLWFRYLLGWALPPQLSLMKYFETETTRALREKHHVVQDMLMPISLLKKSLLYFEEHYQVYPLWVCPMAVKAYPNNIGFIHPYHKDNGEYDELFVDIGAYGSPKQINFDGNTSLAKLENFVIDNHGYQALYARTLMNKEQFRRMFSHLSYDALREKLPLCSRAFSEVYDKVGGTAREAPVTYKKIKETN